MRIKRKDKYKYLKNCKRRKEKDDRNTEEL